MSEFISTRSQSVAVNENVIFDTTMVRPCQAVSHRDSSGVFTLHGNKSYLIIFTANITGATDDTELNLALSIAGEAVYPSRMAVTLDTAGNIANVGTAVNIIVPANCCYTVSVKNIGDTPVTVDNANLIIIKED